MLIGDKAEGSKEGYSIILDREESEIYVLTEKQGLNIGLIAGVSLVWIAFGVFLVILAKRSRKNTSK